MDLSVPLAGKNKAVDVRALPALVTLLQDKATDVRAKAAGAIMTITITTQVANRSNVPAYASQAAPCRQNNYIY